MTGKSDAVVPTAKVERSNSTIDFPYNDLDNAEEIVRSVHELHGTACEYDQLAAHLKQEPRGGGFRLKVTGARCYGFITYERGGRITLTDLGKQLLEPDGMKAARVKGFLNVPLYQRVFDEFKGRQLPPQAGLEAALQSFGVGPKVKEKARQVMLRSAKQAGFFDMSPDRFVMPIIKELPARPVNDAVVVPDSDQLSRRAAGGNDSDSLHPLIQGLLMTLPKPTTTWSIQDRTNWLVMANSIFKMIYPSDNIAGDVKIEQINSERI